MGKGSRWASVIYPLKKSKWGCCLPPDRVKLAVSSKKGKQTATSKWAKGQDGLLLFTPLKSQNGGCCCFPSLCSRSLGIVVWNTGYCFPRDRIKLIVNSKKETKSRVKMGQGSRWASVIYSLKESKWGKRHYGLLFFTP